MGTTMVSISGLLLQYLYPYSALSSVNFDIIIIRIYLGHIMFKDVFRSQFISLIIVFPQPEYLTAVKFYLICLGFRRCLRYDHNSFSIPRSFAP